MSKIILSPYLRFVKTKRGEYGIYNFLTNAYQLWHLNNKTIYEYCLSARLIQDVINRFGEKTVSDLMKLNQLIDTDEVWKKNYVTTLEIETGTVCNWRCSYCPVQYHPREAKFIDHGLFKEIIAEAVAYRHIKEVTLHSFNEPSLDKSFDFYLDQIYETNFKLLLFSNGSYMDDHKLERIGAFENRAELILNFPSLNRDTFRTMTGTDTYDQSLYTLEHALQKKLRVFVNVQGRGKQREAEANFIKKRYPEAIVVTYDSFDRAGALDNEYFIDTKIEQPYMVGCYMVTRSVYVGVQGDLFMCCNDFHKENLEGNIKNGSFQQILSGKLASSIRKKVWGGEKTDADFLCRHCSLMDEFLKKNIFLTYDQFVSTNSI